MSRIDAEETKQGIDIDELRRIISERISDYSVFYSMNAEASAAEPKEESE